MQVEIKTSKLLKIVTAISVLPIIVFLPNAIALSVYVLQKTTLMGSVGSPPYSSFVADGVAGVLIAAVVISVVGCLTPWIAYASGAKLKVCVSFWMLKVLVVTLPAAIRVATLDLQAQTFSAASVAASSSAGAIFCIHHSLWLVCVEETRGCVECKEAMSPYLFWMLMCRGWWGLCLLFPA